ncbi:hypothetical protein SAMN05444157_1622 [Frankineae bacterium MT45]|nr:hypothetical protein SAMN05444157_1622 [Frankineae bacterium MT45]
MDAFWFVQQALAQPFLGTSSDGDVWDVEVPVACWVEDGVKVVRDHGGEETVSTSRIYAALADAPKLLASSLVTTPGSNTPARVIVLERHDSGALGFDIDHVCAHLI